MKNKFLSILFLGTAVGLVILFMLSNSSTHATMINHLGSKYIIDKKLNDYTTKQAKQIEEKIRKIAPPRAFENYEQLILFSENVKVPGYGSSTGGFGDSTSMGRVSYFSVEIPHKNEYRVMVYLQKYDKDEYQLVDDFYTSGDFPPLFTTMEKNNELIYKEDETKRVLRRKMLNN